ncbi:MAG: DoxX family protein [Brooklawnia sp.]
MSIWTGPVAPAQITRDWRDWVGLAARIALGLGLMIAGLLKVGRLDGNVAQVELYQLPLPPWAEVAIGYAQPFIEIVVGLMLLAGLFTRINGALGALAMAAFIAGIAWAWSKGLRIDCGCFTPGGQLDPSEETQYIRDILRDLAWLACGVWLTIRPRSVLAVDNWLLKPVTAFDDFDEGSGDEMIAQEQTN